MSDKPERKGRGRPPGETTLFKRMPLPDYLMRPGNSNINDDILQSAEAAAGEMARTRRQILQHFQPMGADEANAVRKDDRNARLKLISEKLMDPARNFGRMSAIDAAARLASELGFSKHTLRKDIAEIRKLTGPTRPQK